MPILRRITNRLVRAGTQALFSAVNRPGGRFHLVSRPTWHWTMPDWDTVHAIARLDDPRGADLMRLYALHANIRRVLDAGVPGALAELGVYRGVTARLFRHLAPQRRLYLFDTFEGLPQRDIDADPVNKAGRECANTSLALVKQRVGEDGVTYCPGYFPQTASAVPAEERFAVVHLDCDLLEPTRAGLAFFTPRMSPGGIIIVHDYAGTRWPGVAEAVDGFCAGRQVRPVILPDASGTCIIAIPAAQAESERARSTT
jgi:O-methyltransferase